MKTERPGPAGETIDTPAHRALGSASRVAILRLVRTADTGLTGAEVVERTGLHPSTVRVHLERLVEAGLLVRARASGGTPGRPAWRYRAAAPEPAPAPYRMLAAALLEHLAGSGGAQAAAQAGQAWGRHLLGSTELVAGQPGGPSTAPVAGQPDGPVATVVDLLRRLGFDPRPAPGDTRVQPGPDGPVREPLPAGDTAEVHLHTCPFLELVGRYPDVMCGFHAGMITGALRAAGAPDGQALLEPFAAPTACVVRLRDTTPEAARDDRP